MRNDENLLDETEVRSFLSGLAFVREFSINVVSVKPGSVTVELPFDERFSGPPKLFPASMGDVAVLISLLPAERRAMLGIAELADVAMHSIERVPVGVAKAVRAICDRLSEGFAPSRKPCREDGYT